MDKVFPQGTSGLREVPARCWDCLERVPCLKAAVTAASAAKVKGQTGGPAPQDGSRDEEGVGGFLRRWSRLKAQSREGNS